MTKNLTITSPFEPAGSQPKAIETLVNGLNDGLLHQVLLGVTGSGLMIDAAEHYSKMGIERVVGMNMGSTGIESVINNLQEED